MGCDIHLHTELKINGAWHHFTNPNMIRDYAVFAKMANVRNDGTIPPISVPKGVPSDISEITALDLAYGGNDGHSHSWLNKDEIMELDRWLRTECIVGRPWELASYWGFFFNTYWSAFGDSECKHYIPQAIEDIRFVFWFDN